MEIVVTGKGVEITEPIRNYAEEKLSKLPKYFDRITEISLLAGHSDHHQNYEVEIICSVERSDPFVATGTDGDLYACIDQTTGKIERQLHDHKEKLRNRKHTK